MADDSHTAALMGQDEHTPALPNNDHETHVDSSKPVLADDCEHPLQQQQQQQTSPQKTWESRVHKKCGDLRQLFDLPEKEVCMI